MIVPSKLMRTLPLGALLLVACATGGPAKPRDGNAYARPAPPEASAAPAPSAMPMSPVPTQGVAAQLDHAPQSISYNTYFDFNDSTLNAEGRAVVDQAAKQALLDPSYRVNVVGRASRVGANTYNMQLSKRRAEAIRVALIADGVPFGRITLRWVGDHGMPAVEGRGVREPLSQLAQLVVSH